MPGLLETEQDSRSRVSAAIMAEFVGSFLFAFFGGAAPGGVAAPANGIALAVLVYVTANVSGGHLNPAVTIATTMTGHTSSSRAVSYILAQIAGATLASAVHLLLIPGAKGIGCFAPHGISLGQAFGWELLMTLLLVVTVYAVAVGEPSFGVVGPLAIGLALWAAALTGGGFTGAALNPARVLGPALVFGCWRGALVYIAAQLAGAVLAAVASAPLYGTGPQLGKWWDQVQGAARGGYERLEGAVGAVRA